MYEIGDYGNLPDYVSSEELIIYFNSIILYKAKNEKELEALFNELLELADRQWHTYEILSEDIKYRIENWIQKNWDYSSLDITESVVGIVGRLGLEKIYILMQKLINNHNLPKAVKVCIKEAIEEFGESVSNPYQE